MLFRSKSIQIVLVVLVWAFLLNCAMSPVKQLTFAQDELINLMEQYMMEKDKFSVEDQAEIVQAFKDADKALDAWEIFVVSGDGDATAYEKWRAARAVILEVLSHVIE